MSPDQARVLVVDDEPTIAAWTSRALIAVGCEVRSLHTGAALRDALRDSPSWPHVIVMDLSLPDALGSELFDEFSDLALRWIFVTGNVTLPEVQALSDQGVPVIAKPFRANVLRSAVTETLGEIA